MRRSIRTGFLLAMLAALMVGTVAGPAGAAAVSFAPAPGSPYAVGSHPRGITIGDFNGDGVPDMAVANISDNNVSVLLGKGDGTFQGAQNFAVGSGPQGIISGDFNKDGNQDLAVTNFDDNNVSVLLNTPTFPSSPPPPPPSPPSPPPLPPSPGPPPPGMGHHKPHHNHHKHKGHHKHHKHNGGKSGGGGSISQG